MLHDQVQTRLEPQGPRGEQTSEECLATSRMTDCLKMKTGDVIEKDGRKLRIICKEENAFRLVPITLAAEAGPSTSKAVSGRTIASVGSKHQTSMDTNSEVVGKDCAVKGLGKACGETENVLDDGDEPQRNHDNEDVDLNSGYDGEGCEEDEGDGDDDEVQEQEGLRSKMSRKQRVSWTDAEVRKMLSICFDKHVVEKMDGRVGQRLTRQQIFTTVAKLLKAVKMSKQEKTWSHCFDKFKKTCKMYRHCMRKNNKSGEKRHECKFFKELHDLFHKRPTVTSEAWGFDDVEVDEEGNSNPPPDTAELGTDEDTTPSPSSSKKPAKYRCTSVKGGTAAMLKQWMDKEEEIQKKERERQQQQQDAARQHDLEILQTMTNSMATSLSAGFESFARILVGQPSQQQQPHSNIWHPQYSHFQQPQFRPVLSTNVAMPQNTAPFVFPKPVPPSFHATPMKVTSPRPNLSPATPNLNCASTLTNSSSSVVSTATTSTATTSPTGPRIIRVSNVQLSKLLNNSQSFNPALVIKPTSSPSSAPENQQ